MNQENNTLISEEKVDYSSQILDLESIKKRSIISLVFTLTLFLSVVALVLNIINAIKILSTTWKNPEVESTKIVWGIFTIIILGSISSLVFSISGLNKMKK